MARGRPRLSPEEKARRKEQKEESKAQSLAADALLKFPAEPAARKQLFEELSEAKSEAQSAAGAVGAQKKRMQDVFGIDPKTTQIMQTLMSLRQGRRECVIRQVKYLIEDFGLDAQLDLFDEGAVGKADADEGSIFDKTASGDRHAAERGDDPGRARKSKAPTPPAPKPSSAIPLDEARARFEANNVKKKGRTGTVEALAAASAKGDAHIKAVADRYPEDEAKLLGRPAKGAEPPPMKNAGIGDLDTSGTYKLQ